MNVFLMNDEVLLQNRTVCFPDSQRPMESRFQTENNTQRETKHFQNVSGLRS